MPRDRLTWVKFYFTDWAGDLSLQSCSLGARGAWMETLCKMWHDGSCCMTGTPAAWAIRWRCDTVSAERYIAEMEAHGACRVSRNGESVTLMSRRLEREAKARENSRLRVRKHRGNAPVTPNVTGHVTPNVTPHVTDRVLEAQSLRGLEAEKPKDLEIANAGEAPAAEAPKPARTIPKPIVTVAKAFGLTGLCGKLLKDGYEPQRLLAWLLLAARRKPAEPAAWLTACIRGGKQPAEAYMAEALALLSARDAEVAAEHGDQAPSLAAVLPVAEVQGESFAARRNRVLNELKDAEGGGR